MGTSARTGARRRAGTGRRLRGADTGFLLVESESQTSTCTHVVVLEPGDEPGDDGAGGPGLDLSTLTARVAERLDRLPHLRRRLHLVPGGIGHPVLADDPDFRLEDHVLHARLGPVELAAGEPFAQLNAFLATVSGTRLPLDRPLWRLTLVEGMSDGSRALVLQLHHALGDGAATTALITELLDDRATGRPPLVEAADLRPHPAPRPALLFLATLARQLVVWLSLPWMVVHGVRRLRAVRERRAAAPVRAPAMLEDAPRTVLDVSADDRRAYGRCVLSLRSLREVRDAAAAEWGKVGLSDVLVTAVAGALRDHLLARDALPAEPLVVNVPLGDDGPQAAPRVRGNAFVNYYAVLATHLADPLERLLATARNDAEAKAQLELRGRETLVRWLDRLPPALLARAARSAAEKASSAAVDPDYNVVVSNLRFERAGWRTLGHRVRAAFLTGPVTDGHGLNVTVTGFGDDVHVAVHSNPAAVPDPQAVADGIAAHLTLLRTVLTPVPGAAAPGLTPWSSVGAEVLVAPPDRHGRTPAGASDPTIDPTSNRASDRDSNEVAR